MFWADQAAVLERLAAGDPLAEILGDIVRMIERQSDGMVCSLLLVGDDRVTVRHGAAPNLPAEYARQLDGLPIGPAAGSCGTAAHRRERVIVEDIATHPYWDDYRHLALPFGLRACWSSPIFSPEREVLGTFAMYYRTPRGPSDEEIAWVDAATHLAAVCIVNDRTASSLRRSEARLRAVIENTPDVSIQWYDPQGRLTFYNEASRRMFGWSEQSALGKSLLDIDFWGAAEEARFAEFRARAAAGQRVVPTQFAFRRPDGTDGLLLSTVFTIPLSDSTLGFVCMDVDLTEHRRMEDAVRAGEALRALIYDSVTDVLFYIAVEGDGRYRLQSVNRAFLETTGLSEHEVVGHLVEEVIPAASLALVKTKYAEAVSTLGKVSWEEVSRYPAGTRYGEVTVCPILDANGRVTHLVGTVHDVTARREAELERRQIEAQLHQAQRLQALGTLAGGIAHDFNNVLAAIHANLDMLLGPLHMDGEAREMLLDVQRAADRATGMVRQISTFSRKSEPQHELLQLQPIVQEALKLLRAAAIRTPTKLQTTVSADAPTVLGDSTQIIQVIMNLVTNAAHAVGEGGVIEVVLDQCTVAAGARTDAPELVEGSYARLIVRDDGPGMDRETVRRAFEPFFTTKPVGEGTGLGLSVVHGIVKSHDGAVMVRSEPGRGTTFEVLFPAAVPTRGGATPRVEAPRRILFVDGDEAVVFLARRAFSQRGHRISAHSSSVEALGEFREHPSDFDVVITEVSMPQLDGPDLVRQLRQIRPDVRVVLTSETIGPEDIVVAKDLEVTNLLEKPRSLHDLVKVVEPYLR